MQTVAVSLGTDCVPRPGFGQQKAESLYSLGKPKRNKADKLGPIAQGKGLVSQLTKGGMGSWLGKFGERVWLAWP